MRSEDGSRLPSTSLSFASTSRTTCEDNRIGAGACVACHGRAPGAVGSSSWWAVSWWSLWRSWRSWTSTRFPGRSVPASASATATAGARVAPAATSAGIAVAGNACASVGGAVRGRRGRTASGFPCPCQLWALPPGQRWWCRGKSPARPDDRLPASRSTSWTLPFPRRTSFPRAG